MKKSTETKKSTNYKESINLFKKHLVRAVENLLKFCGTQKNNGKDNEYSCGDCLFFGLKI